jgi:hypothetical protein
MTIRGTFHGSRRQFVSAFTAGVGAWTLLPRCLRAATRPSLPFVVVTDTHLGYRDQPDAAQQWERTAAEIDLADAAFVVHLGDIVDGGREPQYPIYLKTRETIGKPVHEIPGNHDPRALFEKHIRPTGDIAVDHQWLRLLLLNNARVDSHDGFLTDDQVDWIDRQCDDAGRRDMLLAIAMHVPAHPNGHPDRGWYIKPENGQTRLYETLARHQDRILALLHGHFHNGIRGWDDHAPLHEICFPSALYNQDRRLEEQQAPGYNPAEFRPGFTRVSIEGATMRLEYVAVGAMATTEKSLALPQLGGGTSKS